MVGMEGRRLWRGRVKDLEEHRIERRIGCDRLGVGVDSAVDERCRVD